MALSDEGTVEEGPPASIDAEAPEHRREQRLLDELRTAEHRVAGALNRVARLEFIGPFLPRRFHEFLYHRRNILICVLAALVTYVALQGQEPLLQRTMAVFVFAASSWLLEALPLYITGLSIPMLLALAGVLEPDEAFRPFAHQVIFLMIGGLVLAQAIQRHGLDRRIAYATLIWSRGSIDRLVLLVMLVTAFMSMWMSNTAAVAVLLPVMFSIMAALPEDRVNLRWKLLLGLTIASTIGGMAMLTGSPPNLIAAAALDDARAAGGGGFGFAEWAVYGLPVSLLSVLAVFLVLRWRYPSPDARLDVEAIARQRREAGPLNWNQKTVVGVFAATIFLWFSGGAVEEWLGLPPSISSAAMVSIVSIVALSALGLLDMKDVHEVRWEIIFLLGGGLVLGEALMVSGAAERMGSWVAGGSAGLPLIAVVGVFLALTVLLTNFISNTATAAILVPIALQTASALGADPTPFLIGIGLAASIAFITPVGTASTAIVYSTGMLPKGVLLRNGLVAAAVTALVVLAMVWLLSLAT
jgi:sodium-dependent dicarboxylate transporter 2/3/5